MADADAFPESDRAGDAPHPREHGFLFGHDATLGTLHHALVSGRMPHALILAGPKGIGKATLAYRLARYLLTYGASGGGPASLMVPAGSPVFHQVAAQAHPDLLVMRRPWDFERKRLKTELPVDEVRRLQRFFSQHASAGRARVAILDSADDLNANSENALLKPLEEPPSNAFLILIAHAPGKLLPTIRSRCRTIRMKALGDDDVMRALDAVYPGEDTGKRNDAVRLSGGSPGQAVLLLGEGGQALYASLAALLSAWPALDLSAAHALGGEVARAGQEARFALLRDMVLGIFGRVIRAASGVATAYPSDAETRFASRIGTLGVRSLLDLQARVTDLLLAAEYANLDKRQALVTAFAEIAGAARGRVAAA